MLDDPTIKVGSPIVVHASAPDRILIAILQALPRDRALARRIRRRPDRDLLLCAPLIVRGDLAENFLVRHGKGFYERFLDAYWRRRRLTSAASPRRA